MFFCAAHGPLKDFANSIIEFIQDDGTLGISISRSDSDTDSSIGTYFNNNDSNASSYDSLDELTHVSTVIWTASGGAMSSDSPTAAAEQIKVEPKDRGELVAVTPPAGVEGGCYRFQDFHCSMDLDLIGEELFQNAQDNILRALLCAHGGKLTFAVVGEQEDSTDLAEPTTINFLHRLLQVILAHH